MKTTTKNRMAVAAILLALLAIGGGVIYTRDRDEKNDQNKDRSYASLAWSMDTIDVRRPIAPVARPVADATPIARPTAYASAGRKKPARRKHIATPGDDQVSLATSETYGGNMPLVPLTAEDAMSDADPVAEKPFAPTKTVIVRKEVTKISVPDSRPWRRVNIAPEVGVNSSAFYNTHSNHMEVMGFHAGAMVNIGLGEHVALQPGALFIMKGNKDERTNYYEDVPVTTTNQLSLNYMEMPLNVVYKFGDDLGKPRFMVGIGPYVSYLVSSSYKIHNDEGFGGAPTTVKLANANNSGLKKWDAGGGGFFGCQLPKGLYARAGLEMGVLDLQQSPSDYRHGDNNYTFYLSLGYILGRKGKDY